MTFGAEISSGDSGANSADEYDVCIKILSEIRCFKKHDDEGDDITVC